MDFASIFAPVIEAAKAVAPVLAGSLGVTAVAVAKKGLGELDDALPPVWKPVVSTAIGAFLSSLLGGTPVEGAAVALATNKARDIVKGK